VRIDQISAVTDEVDPDISIAVGLLESRNVRQCEVRFVGDRRVPDLAPRELAALAAAGRALPVRSLSPGLFKAGMRGSWVRDEIEAKLPRALQLALDLEVPQVIVFGGGGDGSFSDCVSALRDARDAAEGHGVELLVENSAGCRTATAADLARIVEATGLRVVWDPGNAAAAGAMDLVDDTASLAAVTACVHVRDRDRDGWRRVGEGDIPWQGIVAALDARDYSGRYVVETHMPYDPGATEWNLDRVREWTRERD
jgi:sugar phosphate isomerase/epimerase